MGNLFTRNINNKNNNLELPLLDISNNYPYDNNVNKEIVNYISIMRNEILNLSNKVESLDNRINEINNTYKPNIYNINEQLNLINKDLQSLLNNDKILLEKYNNIENSRNTPAQLDAMSLSVQNPYQGFQNNSLFVES